MPTWQNCAVYPEVPIVVWLDQHESAVSIKFGDFGTSSLVLDFFEVDDLRRLRGAVDNAERLLLGRIAYNEALPDPPLT
jgi:hypothetical protein